MINSIISLIDFNSLSISGDDDLVPLGHIAYLLLIN